VSVSERPAPARRAMVMPGLKLFAGLPITLKFGIVLVAFWVALAALAGIVAPYEPNAHDLTIVLNPPNWQHWLGTDNYGRDVLSRVIYSTRIDLQMGIIAVFFPFVLGTTLGAISGYFGGWIDMLLMRLLDVTMAFPFYVLMLAIISILEFFKPLQK
jgi:peptide/nickel transport system permease protein